MKYRFLHFPVRLKGFVLPFTMLIATLVLFVASTSSTLLSKQIYFSKLYRQSQAAYYAADDAISCVVAVDDTYTAEDGLGIFPSSTTTPAETYIANVITYTNAKRADAGLPAITLGDIKCGQSALFDVGTSSFKVAPANFEYHSPTAGIEEGKTVTFTMKMDLGVDPADLTGTNHLYRCAFVTVNKTPSYRQIISQGYSSCDNRNTAVERAVINTTVAE